METKEQLPKELQDAVNLEHKLSLWIVDQELNGFWMLIVLIKVLNNYVLQAPKDKREQAATLVREGLEEIL